MTDIPTAQVCASQLSGALVSGAFTLAGVFIGSALTLLSEPLKVRLFGPRLKLQFVPNDKKHVADSSMNPPCQGCAQTVQSRWIRISVINKGRSHLSDAKAFIVNVEMEENGCWKPTFFIDPLSLSGSATDPETAFLGRELPREIPFFIDACRSTEGIQSKNIPDKFGLNLRVIPGRIANLFSGHARYRLTAQVTGHSIKPETKR